MKQAAVYNFPEPKGGSDQPVEAQKRTNEGAKKDRDILKGFFLTPDDLVKCLHEQKDGLLITNSEGIGLWVNGAMEKVVGLTPGYFINQPISLLFEKGIFKYQAVTERARREKNELTDVQVVNTGNTVLVTSIPVTEQERQLKYMITTVRNMAYLHPFPLRGEEKSPDKDEITPALRSLGIIYRSRAMQKVIELAARVAATDATVLITGETGVGKELIARLIHRLSNRQGRPFLQINCTALPKELAEAELFGYERGAFTGARPTGKKGLFEVADGGTILLDEIGEMPMEMQAKLLRFLQNQEFLRLGGTQTVQVNVRVLAATNCDLFSQVNEMRFRSDLFYRLNVVNLHVPPLRLRPEDIPLLLGHYLRLFCQKYRVYRQFTPDTFRLLLKYSWPGNIRELTNLVHHLVLINDQAEITPASLPEYIKEGLKRVSLTQEKATGGLPGSIPGAGLLDGVNCGTLRELLESIEKGIIEATLKNSLSIRDASRRLGVPHPTLIDKMKKYSLVKEIF
ncbi:MAG: sigma 54-interacting transcriptional regulator [Armatimonadetes bacterium]|nr:sigma 54-interacting transcriptional regulator [Armatimonadota bacterium]